MTNAQVGLVHVYDQLMMDTVAGDCDTGQPLPEHPDDLERVVVTGAAAWASAPWRADAEPATSVGLDLHEENS
jgi:hypothetical protein